MTAAKKIIAKDWLGGEAKTGQAVDLPRTPLKMELGVVTRSEDLPEWISQKKAAALIGCHYKTVEDLRKAKEVAFVKRRGRYFTTPEWIADYLNRTNKP